MIDDRAVDVPPTEPRPQGELRPQGAPSGLRPPGRGRRLASLAVVVALTVLLIAVYVVVQYLAAIAMLVPPLVAELAQGRIAADQLAAWLSEQTLARIGLLAWVGITVSVPVVLLATWAFGRRHFGRDQLGRRLGLRLPRLRHALAWLLAVVGFGMLWERLVVWLDRPPMPDVMYEIFTTAGWLPGLVVAVVVFAPVIEEAIFRGFCIGGLAPFGAPAAIAISALLFASIHIQYDPVDMSGVLVLGALFGASRWHTGSTLLPLGLHALHNGMATMQALWLIGAEAGG